jgi:hypothetical protein
MRLEFWNSDLFVERVLGLQYGVGKFHASNSQSFFGTPAERGDRSHTLLNHSKSHRRVHCMMRIFL